MSLVLGQEVVLASASAARARILARAGIQVVTDAASLDEAEIRAAFLSAGASVEDCAVALARSKALAVSPRHPGTLVVGADQILQCAGAWFEKPVDRDHARAHLTTLRGKRHELVTAVCAVRDGQVLWHAVDRPRLTMRPFSDAFLEDYLQAMGDDALQSVGAYQLEGLGAQLFSTIEGDYFSILGLPLLPLLAFLRDHGVIGA